jgi:toxin-antitoxin system PIN domain toxin
MAPQAELVLLDTNILVYAMNKDAAQHGACRSLLVQDVAREIPVAVAPQVLFEYFAVVTSAKQMTIPLSATDAANDVEYLRRALPVVHPGPGVVARTLELLRVLGHSGRHVFDVVLAATMMESGINAIFTYDDRFAKMPGIVALTPNPAG